jgi:hypothetical protein
VGGGGVEGLGAEALDGGEAGSGHGFRRATPAVLAATQSFQSLECLFLSLCHSGDRPRVGGRVIVYVHVSMAAAARAASRLSVPWRVSSFRARS